MAPRKQKPSKEEFRNLTLKHNIHFERQVQPRDWRQHQHYFQAIRNIASKSYEDYMQDTSIKRWKRELYQSRVVNMQERACELIEDFDINEDTWRASFEDVVSKPFKKSPVCRRCGGETWIVDFEANPPDTDLRATLEEKRARRKRCSCASEKPNSRPEPSDETEVLFSFHAGGEISHCQGDDFGNLSIPMRPDRVIGLKGTTELKRYTLPALPTLTPSPIRGRNILYPFLVVEAKKDEAPGFPAIHDQTAFPVRRLLVIQDELKAAAGIECEPSLVWFFAYRGDEWRLSAATRDTKDTKVRIYDLWDGKIQSRDGALRLLLIIDYIWSWARDIYRPSILGRLRSLRRHNSESTISSPPPSRCFSSISSSFGDWEPADGPSLSSNAAVNFPGAGPSHAVMDGIEYQGSTLVEVADSHSFLKWAGGHPLSPPWTQVASIRHSDIVSFKLRIVIFPLYRESLDKFLRSAYASLYEHSFVMTKQQLIQLGIIWNKTRLSENDINDKIRVTFLFQTYCNHLWEIERVLSCIVWTDLDLNAPDPAGRDITLAWPNFVTLIEGMQRIRGKNSAQCALREVTLILSSSERNVSLDTQTNMQWTSLQDVGMSPEAANELIDVRNLGPLTIPEVRCLPEQQKRLLVRPHLEGELMDLFDCEDDPGNQEAMVAVRPTSWSTQCTKFCLFVFLESRYDNKEKLSKLLQGALRRRLLVNDDYRVDESDKIILRKWYAAVKDI